MFEVTEKAIKVINTIFKNQEDQVPLNVRILMQAGWKGPKLGMALDEPSEKDMTITEKGITFIMDKNLYEEAKPIHIDFVKDEGGPRIQYTTCLNLPQGCWEKWFDSW